MWKNVIFAILIFLIFKSCQTVPYSNIANVNNQKSFEELMKIDALDKKSRALEALNLFLNETPYDKNAAVLIENNSNCNIVVRINGAKNYQLPIVKMGKNYVVLPKGSYQFRSNVCNTVYNSTKNLVGSITITLNTN